MFRNIIWDVDGTLFDTYPAIARAIKAALQDLDQDAPLAWIEELAKESLSRIDAILADTYQLDPAALDRAIDRHFDRITLADSPPFPGATELCQYICSSKGQNVIVTHRGRAGTLELLTGHQLIDYFAGCITRDDGYARKPDPAAFEAALTTYHLNRAETLTVGDREIDMVAGQAAGLFSCFYGPAPNGLKADLVIKDFAELYQYLVMA